MLLIDIQELFLTVTINVPSVGRIPNGANVERSVPTEFAGTDNLTLNLHQSDFTTATHLADSINKQLTAIEETFYQTKAKSGQDVLNYPIRLNDKLSGLFDAANSGNMTPSRQVKDVFADLSKQCDEQLAKLKKIK